MDTLSKKNTAILCLLITILSIRSAYGDFTAQCPPPCECKWFSGNKAASCADSGLTSIPNKLSSDIQNLNLSFNPLYEIIPNAFDNVGLVNLKKLFLINCQIESINKDGFKNLKIMIEIDISKNSIRSLHRDTFSSNERVRVINLNDNLLEELENGLFENLQFLQNIYLSNNRIFKIGTKTFVNLPVLKKLTLNSNNLTHIRLEALSKLTNLSSLELQRNLWKCDCHLQSFRNWVIDHNLYTHPTTCSEPARLENRNWNELDSTEFACKPIIIEPMQDKAIQASNENITLSCKVTGNPKPDVSWAQNSVVLDGMSRRHGENRHVIRRNDLDLTVWVNLTIFNVKYHDRGDYTCVAKNPGGSDSRIISLTVNRNAGAVGSGVSANESLLLIVGLSVGAIILLIIIVLLCYCFCKKKDIKRHIKSDMHSSNGEALIEGSVIPEMEKSLITTVNPLTKPPRRYDAPISNTSGGTEMSELNKTLLDSDSIFG